MYYPNIHLGKLREIKMSVIIKDCSVQRVILFKIHIGNEWRKISGYEKLSYLVNKANPMHNFSQYVYFFSLHVSGDYVPIIRRNNCIYVMPGICHSVWMTVWQAGWNEFLSGKQGGMNSTLHTRQSSTQSDRYQVSHIQGVPGGMCQTSGECSLN